MMKDVEKNHEQMFRLTEKECPEIKDWEPGKTYKMEMMVEMMNKGKDYSDEHGGTFKIKSIRPVEEDKIKKLSAKYIRH